MLENLAGQATKFSTIKILTIAETGANLKLKED